MHDWAGWLLLLFSFSIVLMWKSIRDDTKVVLAIWFCLVLHHAVVFLSVYIPDADGFHVYAYKAAASSETEWFSETYSTFTGAALNYAHSLGLIYRTFGVSYFLGQELAVLAFVLSCVVLVKLVDLLDLRRFCVGIMLLFGFLPSAVVHRSVPIREAWQALFFLLFLYWAIRLWKRPGILILLFMLMSALGMAFLHYGLTRYVIYLIVMSLYWGICNRKMGVRWTRYVRLLFAGLLIACVIILTQKMGVFMTLEEAVKGGKGIRQTLLAYTEVRTNFRLVLDTSSLLGIVTTFPMIFVEYMFAPFPWQIGNVKDICAFLESMLRFLLLFFAISLWRRSSGEVRSCYGFLLIAVLGIECMWALGTANWGTAIRHHVLGYSVFVLLGAPRLILFVRELQFGIFGRRKVSGELKEQSPHMS